MARSTTGGATLAPDEVEILATPPPGTVVAHDEGLVVVIDMQSTDHPRAQGDARQLQRAIEDLRKDAALELDDRIAVWIDGLTPAVAAHLVRSRRRMVLPPDCPGSGPGAGD